MTKSKGGDKGVMVWALVAVTSLGMVGEFAKQSNPVSIFCIAVEVNLPKPPL